MLLYVFVKWLLFTVVNCIQPQSTANKMKTHDGKFNNLAILTDIYVLPNAHVLKVDWLIFVLVRTLWCNTVFLITNIIRFQHKS